MKYVPSLMVGQLSGSAGSTTASRNRFGSYFRNRVQPTNPNSGSQQTYRQRLQDLSGQWRDLSDEQRTGWALVGDQMTRQNSLGQTYTLTGLQAYTSVNLNRLLIGSAILEDPPVVDNPPENFSLSAEVDFAASPPTIPLTSDLVLSAGQFVVIEATPGVSEGISFMPRSSYKQIAVLSNAQWGSPEPVGQAYEDVFGTGANGTRVFFAMRVITANGFAGARVTTSVISEAGA